MVAKESLPLCENVRGDFAKGYRDDFLFTVRGPDYPRAAPDGFPDEEQQSQRRESDDSDDDEGELPGENRAERTEIHGTPALGPFGHSTAHADRDTGADKDAHTIDDQGAAKFLSGKQVRDQRVGGWAQGGFSHADAHAQ